MSLDRRTFLAITAASLTSSLFASPSLAAADDFKGAGSTFVQPLLDRLASAYFRSNHIKLKYEGGGSGQGISRVENKTVDFGASDEPLRSDPFLKDKGLGQFPLVSGGVAILVNGLPQNEPFKLTPPVLAAIFSGGRVAGWEDPVTSWDHPAIKAINPGLDLPAKPITVFSRADNSGTTFTFTSYLAAVSGDWEGKAGKGFPFKVAKGQQGNSGVVNAIRNNELSTGYADYADAQFAKSQNRNLSLAHLQNQAGQFIAPDPASFQAALANAKWDSDDFYQLLINDPGKTSYPIVATTFVLMPVVPRDVDRAALARDFFLWAIKSPEARKIASDNNYVPLPESLIPRVENYIGNKFVEGPNGTIPRRTFLKGPALVPA